MAIYMLGSLGKEVEQIQKALGARGFYRGPIDGQFGGGTDAAVRAFQKSAGLAVDGRVGPITWKALLTGEIPEPEIIAHELNHRVLVLTGSFENGVGYPECFAGLSGDFDKQGLSLGALQWNFGQDSLQPLLDEMIKMYRPIMEAIFGDNFAVLEKNLHDTKRNLMRFARSIQDPISHRIYEPWRGMFKTLGRTDEFREIQETAAAALFGQAVQLGREYGLWSERAVALMFDILVQNGGIRSSVKKIIRDDFRKLSFDLTREEKEVAMMRAVARRRAEDSLPEWRNDVLMRKLCCANGGGPVHGINYNLETQFGIHLIPAE